MIFNHADKVKIKEMAKKYDLKVDIVEKIVSAPYKFIRSQTRKTTFVDDMTREEFDGMKKNFNIPGIGKLYASHFLYEQIQKKKKKKKLGS